MTQHQTRDNGQNKAETPDGLLVIPPVVTHFLTLYIAGLSPRSTIAVERIRSICDRYLAGQYELTVVDLFLQPELARQAQIVVAPTLVKLVPAPRRLFIGDMSDEKTILLGLNIVA